MDIVTYILSKKYVEDSLAGAGALVGKSAYDIACENGFKGTPSEWLATLKGDSPQIGPDGNWIVAGVNTGVIASPGLAGYATEEFVNQQIANIDFPETDLSAYATREELGAAILGITIPDVSGFATKEELEEAIRAIPAPDLTPFATKEELQQAIANIPEVDLGDYATKQFVNEAIANIPQPDLGGYVTSVDLAVAIAGIEHPVTDLSGLASEDFVTQKIAEAKLSEGEVDLSAYYTKTEIDNKFDALEIPEQPDLSNFATKDEIPNVDGLASEKFVTEAIAAIEIPEVKSDVKVYEISSDSAVLDELVALLPEGIEINQGDVMLVTNALGVKSAYQYDEGWIACDGNVDASRVIMPFDITLAGSYTQVGNLSKTSTGTATFATRGKSVAAALQEMLSKREQPKIESEPAINLVLTNVKDYEVGTNIAPSYTVSLSPGSYTYGPDPNITAKAWFVSDTDGNSSARTSATFPIKVVSDFDYYRITAQVEHDAGQVAYDNLGDDSNPEVKIAKNSAAPVTKGTLRGYRSWFIYVGSDCETLIDSDFIRKSASKGNGANASTQNNVSIPQGTKRIVIAIPKAVTNAKFTYNKSLKSVIDVDGMGLDVFNNFNLIEIEVEGANNYESIPYNVWICENANGLAATKYNLIIS